MQPGEDHAVTKSERTAARRQHLLEVQAEALRRSRAANGERAVTHERVRIARELHDVLLGAAVLFIAFAARLYEGSLLRAQARTSLRTAWRQRGEFAPLISLVSLVDEAGFAPEHPSATTRHAAWAAADQIRRHVRSRMSWPRRAADHIDPRPLRVRPKGSN
jgi:hypothetical protein